MKLSWDIVPFSCLYLDPSSNGLTRPSAVRGSGFKMVNMGELYSYPRLHDPPMERVSLSEKEKSKYALSPGDLLFARQSLVLEGAGKCAVVMTCEENTTFESHLIRVRLDRTKADPLFYYYFFKSGTGTGTIQTIVNQVAAAGIRGSDLAKLRVLCPPIAQQRKIAAILSAYDDLIENNQRRITLLEEMAEQIYREWFVRLRFPGHQTVKKVKGIPEGWTVKKLGELVRTQYGYTASADMDAQGPRFLRITDIVPSTIDWDSVPRCLIDENIEAKYLLHEGDIVVARTGATVGYAKRINKRHPKAVFASYLVRLIPNSSSDALFLGLSVERSAFKDFISMFVTGAAQPQANATTMAQFPVLHPPEPLLREFNQLVEPIIDQKEALQTLAASLSQVRNLLLSRLISGKLSVEHLDIKFPLSMDELSAAQRGTGHA